MAEICKLEGVREYNEDYPVSLVKDEDTAGRLAIRAVNEGSFNCTEIDLADLIVWLANAGREFIANDEAVSAALRSLMENHRIS